MTGQVKRKRSARVGAAKAATKRRPTDAKLVDEAKKRLERGEKRGTRAERENVKRGVLEHELRVHQIELEMQNEELRAALVEAQRAKDKYSELFQFLPVGIVVVDRMGIVREANLATGIWLGLDRRTLVKTNVRFLIEREDHRRFEKFFGRMLATPARQSIEVRLRGARDEPLWMQITGVALQGDQGGEQVFYLAMTDITARVNAERVLARDKEAVERLVEQRSTELVEAHAALEKVRRLADIGQLATMVAHELRNPLAAIMVAAEGIRSKAGAAPVEKFVDSIDKKVRESDQIINNLLFYSRLKSPRFERVDLCAVLDEVAAQLRSRTGSGKSLTVVCDDEASRGLAIDADAMQLKELLMNVASNAYDAISDGGTIEVAAEEDGAGHALIRIKDNGVGIPEAELHKIWHPFYSTKSKGTGLGLSVVNQIVSLHGGTVGVESEPGKGTTVTIRVPLRQKKRGGADGAEPA